MPWLVVTTSAGLFACNAARSRSCVASDSVRRTAFAFSSASFEYFAKADSAIDCRIRCVISVGLWSAAQTSVAASSQSLPPQSLRHAFT